jgi:hypothetical protein
MSTTVELSWKYSAYIQIDFFAWSLKTAVGVQEQRLSFSFMSKASKSAQPDKADAGRGHLSIYITA